MSAHVGAGRRWWLFLYVGLVLVFLVIPSVIVVPMSLTDSTFLEFPPQNWSLRWYESYVQTAEWRAATIVSLQIACVAVLIAVPAGTAAAYSLHVSTSSGKVLLAGMLIAPTLVPHILVAVGLFFAFGPLRLSNTLIGLALAHAMLTLPFVFILVSAGLRNYDMITERAARSLGASRLRAFFTITLPQIKNSVIFSALIAFITSLDEVIIGLFLANGPLSTLPRRMFLSLRDAIEPTIAAISSILIVLSILVVCVSQLSGQTAAGETR